MTMAVRLESGNTLGTDICRVLGIDVDQVRSVTLRCDASQPAHVEIVRFLSTDEAGAIKSTLERYELKGREP